MTAIVCRAVPGVAAVPAREPLGRLRTAGRLENELNELSPLPLSPLFRFFRLFRSFQSDGPQDAVFLLRFRK
jgi:hypothetical protein